jgi:hypothetical protein
LIWIGHGSARKIYGQVAPPAWLERGGRGEGESDDGGEENRKRVDHVPC